MGFDQTIFAIGDGVEGGPFREIGTVSISVRRGIRFRVRAAAAFRVGNRISIGMGQTRNRARVVEGRVYIVTDQEQTGTHRFC